MRIDVYESGLTALIYYALVFLFKQTEITPSSTQSCVADL